MIRVLLAAPDDYHDAYLDRLKDALAAEGLKADVAIDHPPAKVDYIVYAPSSGLDDFKPFTRAKAVLNLWAGVEDVADNPTLTLPLARMVDEGLTEGMVEYVTAQVLRHHLEIDRYIGAKRWTPHVSPLARDRTVGILGLGALGKAAATALNRLNFNVAGWSRSEKAIPGVATFAGSAGFRGVLERSDILVLLLPLTAATENLLDAEALAHLPKGAVVINAGRGPLIDDAALLSALESGALGHATLDVFREEPLPEDHPYWAHPRVTVTPHIAAATRPATAAQAIAQNIARCERGEPLRNLVDRDAGY